MPLQNRVAPWGEFIATAARGSLMGNRGILHDETGTLGRSRWKHEKWVTCRLEFRGRRRAPMAPGRYTALFFLDEATALAAGHRPCGECRRAHLAAFRAALGDDDMTLTGLDRQLHRERVDLTSRQARSHRADIAGLPDGTMILTPEGPTRAALLVGRYDAPVDRDGLPRPPAPAGLRRRRRADAADDPPRARRRLSRRMAGWLNSTCNSPDGSRMLRADKNSRDTGGARRWPTTVPFRRRSTAPIRSRS